MQRSIPAEGWLPSLNGLRALSVTIVIGSHLLYAHPELNVAPLALVLSGDLGVRIFFVISGFLISTLMLKEMDAYGSVSLKRFYLRRALRLLPLQFSFVAFLFLLTLLTSLKIDTCEFITAITFTKNYACRGWVEGHLWSLAVEEQFYLMWPIVLISMRARNVRVFALLLICLAPVSRAIEYLLGHRLYTWLPSNADVLMIGCLLALYAHRHRGELGKIAAWHPSATRMIAALLMYVPDFLGSRVLLGKLTITLGPTLQAICAATLIVSLVYNHNGFGFRVLNLNVVSYIGAISYSLYIWHGPFIARPDSYGGQDQWFLSFPLDLLVVILVAMTSYHLLERPFVRLRRRLHSQ
ncbi:MAG: acyltransferase family protein [Xanthobacteraceae bacterium]